MSIINNKQYSARANITLKSGEKLALCRCWKSEKFPFCDGSHNKLNQENDDNVGPIIVSGEE